MKKVLEGSVHFFIIRVTEGIFGNIDKISFKEEERISKRRKEKEPKKTEGKKKKKNYFEVFSTRSLK